MNKIRKHALNADYCSNWGWSVSSIEVHMFVGKAMFNDNM